jgi:hypothetical protein
MQSQNYTKEQGVPLFVGAKDFSPLQTGSASFRARPQASVPHCPKGPFGPGSGGPALQRTAPVLLTLGQRFNARVPIILVDNRYFGLNVSPLTRGRCRPVLRSSRTCYGGGRQRGMNCRGCVAKGRHCASVSRTQLRAPLLERVCPRIAGATRRKPGARGNRIRFPHQI